jgi:glycosyltransferase involved in cell wall biosynthesis
VPRISVVVPIYDVEAYLRESLESLAAQTVRDFEVVMVDDGSTDGSAAIAEEFVARDRRFRLLSRPNGGLSRARNTGIADARGELLAFLDSDDLLPPDAYERLLGALEQTGSDFASGNVHRLTTWGESQTRFLAEAFATSRLKTHVTEFRPLLADRTAWNKLWRRSFWGDRRFPEGVVHEDIPVVLPAHFEARSVDVIAEPVYLYRVREGSITQRRLEPTVLLDRLAAIEHVSDWLAQHGPPDAQRWYHEHVLHDDLRLHLEVLDRADAAYRELFLDRVNAFLDRVEPDLLDDDWRLVRRRAMPELVERVRAENRATLKMRLARRVPVRYRRRLRSAVRGLRSRS